MADSESDLHVMHCTMLNVAIDTRNLHKLHYFEVAGEKRIKIQYQ